MAGKSNQTIAVDMELKKAFQELQGKLIATTQQLKLSDAQIETLKRTKQHSLLVEKELDRLPENTRVYEGVGRMFMLAGIPEVKKTLEMKMKAADSKIKTIEKHFSGFPYILGDMSIIAIKLAGKDPGDLFDREGSKAYLERNMKESEDSLRELILTKQGRG